MSVHMNIPEAAEADVKLPREFVLSRLVTLGPSSLRAEWGVDAGFRGAGVRTTTYYKLDLKQCFLRKLNYAFGWGDARWVSWPHSVKRYVVGYYCIDSINIFVWSYLKSGDDCVGSGRTGGHFHSHRAPADNHRARPFNEWLRAARRSGPRTVPQPPPHGRVLQSHYQVLCSTKSAYEPFDMYRIFLIIYIKLLLNY